MTIGEFLVIYERNHVARLKSRRGTSQRLQKYVGQLAAIPLGDLKKIQVLDWFHAIEQAKGGSAANRAIQDLHSLYVKASDWEIYEGKNPADRVKKFPKQSRERFVQSNELPWLLKALADEIPRNETYFPCLLLTGARRDEARLMKWTHLDLGRSCPLAQAHHEDRSAAYHPLAGTTRHPDPAATSHHRVGLFL